MEPEENTTVLNMKSGDPPPYTESEAPPPRHFRISDSLPGRIVFTYGSEDPWTTMGVAKGWRPDVPVLTIEGGSHCSDLGTAAPYDTEAMRQARATVRATILDWSTALIRERKADLQRFGGSAFPRPGLADAFGNGS